MTAILGAAAIAVGSSFALLLIVKATAVAGGAFIAAHIARRARAAIRHLILVSAFIVLAAMPVVSGLMPPRDIDVVIDGQAAAVRVPASVPLELDAPSPAASDDLGRATASGDTLPKTLRVLHLIWILGGLTCLVPPLLGWISIRRLHGHARPWRRGQAMVDAVTATLPIHRPIRMLLDDTLVGPVTYGALQPVLAFPIDARRWSPSRLRRAILHELEHVRRWDWMTLCLVRVVCAMYWFHPLVWMASRQLCLEAERACDDAVLSTDGPEEYAGELVALAERLINSRTRSAIAMASRVDLRTRVVALFDDRPGRGPAGPRWRTIACGIVFLLLVGFAPVRAVGGRDVVMSQSPERDPRFDVASVKPTLSPFELGKLAASGAPMPSTRKDSETPNGRLYIGAISLKSLLMRAYGIKEHQIAGGPEWLASDYFEVEANAGRNATPEEMRAMLKTLLTDRFGLRVHEDTRPASIYALILARSDGQLGPGFKRTSPECERTRAAGKAGTRPRGIPTEPVCGIMIVTSSRSGPTTHFMGGYPLADLIPTIARELKAPVIDRTGLEGLFDITVQYASVQRLVASTLDASSGATAAPGIVEAVREQLGLKLEKQTAPLSVLVVDAVNRPSPN